MNNTIKNHWADITADKIIRNCDKDTYVCASGITPSGTVHIGNFREIISVELVVRALREKGKNVKFIYSWDDYDVFRKVPKNMPEQDLLTTYLRKPITIVPDVFGIYESYAQYNEKELEKYLPIVGVEPNYIYQASKYRKSDYAQGMKTALDKRDEIIEILNRYRTSDLANDWQPVSVFCNKCDRDTTKVLGRTSEWEIEYSCDSCGNHEVIDLRTTKAAKLPWRIDWPMRWSYEGVDFEPAGKDHHSEGGSFDTAEEVSTKIFDKRPPETFQYDFISIKGRGGKISSSGGEVISLPDVLEVYTPEITRFLFAGTRPNTEFAISFDLDVLKIYEDYEIIERAYFSQPEGAKAQKKKEKTDRIYELSQVHGVPEEMPYQIPIRHLCNILQIFDGDIDGVIKYLGDINENQLERFKVKATCAWNWIKNFAPEEFKFEIQKEKIDIELSDEILTLLEQLRNLTEQKMESLSEQDFGTELYDLMKSNSVESADFFKIIYQILIGKEKGPRLISFLYTIGKDKIINLLDFYKK
ncbi:MAG: lysine--tRNA ligase [Spirochaetales bacterium]|nr:lysine--tRNA ligase [Spirochaetales bacterium]